MKSGLMWLMAGVFGLGAVALAVAMRPDPNRIRVTLEGGYGTDRRDGGRPVALIAGALGVRPDVFRDAFSRVQPARGGEPTRERVHENKAVLLAALGPYGITNDRLDTVSNYYRYRPERGERWPTQEAVIDAIFENGKFVRFEIVSGGHGYLMAPKIRIPSHPEVEGKTVLAFDREFRRNGRISAVR